MKRLLNEPVAIGALVRSVIVALSAFGFQLTAEQTAAIMLVTEAVLGIATRALVTPNQLALERVAAGGSPTVPRNDG